MPESPQSPPPFYVGYLPLPARHRRFLAIVVPMVFVAMASMGVMIATAHRSPGTGQWDVSAEHQWTGTVCMEPYPMLITPEGEGWLLVAMAKAGVHERLEPFAGSTCRVRGFPLRRDHRRMIELLPDDRAIEQLPDAPTLAVRTRSEPIELVSEIVDGKCFLGSMKPGDGKTHKACAVLCLRGGLPPLVATNAAPDQTFPLLLVDGSTTLPESIIGLVGEPVRIRGTLTSIAGVPMIETTSGEIERP